MPNFSKKNTRFSSYIKFAFYINDQYLFSEFLNFAACSVFYML